MAGRFIKGGVQHNVLQQREQEAMNKVYGDSSGSSKGWGHSKTNDTDTQLESLKDSQYSTFTPENKDNETQEYQNKLAQASVRISLKNTAQLIRDAEERQRLRNDAWMDRSKYNEEQAQRRYEKHGYDSYTQFRNLEKYKTEDGYITHPTTGFRYKPRKFDDKMNHTESRGWLHCWTQIMGFDAPQYDVEVSGKTPNQVFTATLTLMTKRGEIIDYQPTFTARSKKLACTEVAWNFIETFVERGLMSADKVPKRTESEQLSNTSGVNAKDVKSIDLSEEGIREGGNWKLGVAMQRFNAFCAGVRLPMDIKLHAYGPDHERKTDAHCTIKFHIMGEKESRSYSASHTCQNKKQAQSAVALTLVRALYKDGLIEAFRKYNKPAPRVYFNKSVMNDNDGTDLTEEEKNITGGWTMANAMGPMTNILKRWGIDPDFFCEPRGKPSRYTYIMFISELRLTLMMKAQGNVISTKHELFAYGRQKSKKDSRTEACMNMMQQLCKFGIVTPAYISTFRPGKDATMWDLKLGLQGATFQPDDIYVNNKINELRPSPEEVLYPSQVINHIEHALRQISEWLHELELGENYSQAMKGVKTLVGMQRVGPIAMDMMLTGERRAHVVLTCSRRPTRKLLENIAGKSVEMLKKNEIMFVDKKLKRAQLDEYHYRMDAAEDEAKKLEEGVKEEEEEVKSETDKNEENTDETSDKKDKETKPDETPETNSGTWDKIQVPPPRTRPDPEYYTIAIEHNNSGFLITHGLLTPKKMIVRVTLTASQIREDYIDNKKLQDEEEGASKPKKQKRSKPDEEKPKEPETEKQPEPEKQPDQPPSPEQTIGDGWTAMAPILPTEEDYAKFKYGPYNKKMSLDECEVMEEEGGGLPIQPGLGALAELRRIKWFQHVGLHTPYLPDICRLIRGLAIREASWKSFRILCPWTIALVLEAIIKCEVKMNNNSTITLSPARVLKMTLECIAKGFRFPVESKPKDKEEKKEIKQEIKEEVKEEYDDSHSRRREKSDRESSKEQKVYYNDEGKQVVKRYTHKLADPCESGKSHDALSHINSSRKSDIRACAKFALDLVERDNISSLLNTEKVEQLCLEGGVVELPEGMSCFPESKTAMKNRERKPFYLQRGGGHRPSDGFGGSYASRGGHGHDGYSHGNSRDSSYDSRDHRSSSRGSYGGGSRDYGDSRRDWGSSSRGRGYGGGSRGGYGESRGGYGDSRGSYGGRSRASSRGGYGGSSRGDYGGSSRGDYGSSRHGSSRHGSGSSHGRY